MDADIETMRGEIVHIAGPALWWDGSHVRQRCAWCGYVLIDSDLTRVMVQTPPEGEESSPFPTWGFMTYVGVYDDNGFRALRQIDPPIDGTPTKVPEGSCFRLPPELTLAVVAESGG